MRPFLTSDARGDGCAFGSMTTLSSPAETPLDKGAPRILSDEQNGGREQSKDMDDRG